MNQPFFRITDCNLLVQRQVRHQLAQPLVLIPQLLGLLRLAGVHPAVLRLPRVQRVLADAHPPVPRPPPCPASICFSAAIISASVCRLRDMLLPSSSLPRTLKSYSVVCGARGAGHPGEIVKDILLAGPFDTYKAQTIGQQSMAEALNSGLPGIRNGPADAWRHCVLSCRLSRELNPQDAQQITEQHEKSGGGPPAENAMDAHNNQVGLRCGRNSPNSCEQACSNSLYGDQLIWIKGPKFIGPPVPQP